ncbi:MAG: hypothetical protein O3A46_13250 [Candidatus Poribacteria bacterium]|nr:hypothetical protein [Candidatus Poribacteria bacterium]
MRSSDENVRSLHPNDDDGPTNSFNKPSAPTANAPNRQQVREYELYVPLEYNEDEFGVRQQIETWKLATIRQRLIEQFGGG